MTFLKIFIKKKKLKKFYLEGKGKSSKFLKYEVSVFEKNVKRVFIVFCQSNLIVILRGEVELIRNITTTTKKNTQVEEDDDEEDGYMEGYTDIEDSDSDCDSDSEDYWKQKCDKQPTIPIE